MISLIVPPQTSVLNKHLQELMDGLTAKVFRTYNASITLQAQLKELTNGTSATAVEGSKTIFTKIQLDLAHVELNSRCKQYTAELLFWS